MAVSLGTSHLEPLANFEGTTFEDNGSVTARGYVQRGDFEVSVNVRFIQRAPIVKAWQIS